MTQAAGGSDVDLMVITCYKCCTFELETVCITDLQDSKYSNNFKKVHECVPYNIRTHTHTHTHTHAHTMRAHAHTHTHT